MWTDEYQKALCELIDYLSNPQVLGYPDLYEHFVLHCDASQEGLGVVLYQRQRGKLVVIPYESRTLTSPEKKLPSSLRKGTMSIMHHHSLCTRRERTLSHM